jgi:hypothetical protein
MYTVHKLVIAADIYYHHKYKIKEVGMGRREGVLFNVASIPIGPPAMESITINSRVEKENLVSGRLCFLWSNFGTVS